MNVQKRPRSSIRARRTACFSVSSSSRYMSLTSCRALSSWGCRSPFPGGVGRRGRAGDAGLARWIRGSGPVAVSLAMGLGTVVGVRGPGRAVGTPGLVEGLVPRAGKEDRQTCTQERHQSCKATLNLGQADSPGQSQGRPWHSHAQESPVETFTAAGTPPPRPAPTAQDSLTAHRMVPSGLPGNGGNVEAGQGRAWGSGVRTAGAGPWGQEGCVPVCAPLSSGSQAQGQQQQHREAVRKTE